MKSSDLLRDYAAYNIWANKKMETWLGGLPNDVFESVVENSFPSLKKTVLHIWGAEFLWHKRLTGSSPSSFAPAPPDETAAETFAKLLSSSNDLHALMEGKPEDWFDEHFDYKNMAGDAFNSIRRDALQHVLNHSTYHRGQLVTMGRSLGILKPPSTDLIFWARER